MGEEVGYTHSRSVVDQADLLDRWGPQAHQASDPSSCQRGSVSPPLPVVAVVAVAAAAAIAVG